MSDLKNDLESLDSLSSNVDDYLSESDLRFVEELKKTMAIDGDNHLTNERMRFLIDEMDVDQAMRIESFLVNI